MAKFLNLKIDFSNLNTLKRNLYQLWLLGFFIVILIPFYIVFFGKLTLFLVFPVITIALLVMFLADFEEKNELTLLLKALYPALSISLVIFLAGNNTFQIPLFAALLAGGVGLFLLTGNESKAMPIGLLGFLLLVGFSLIKIHGFQATDNFKIDSIGIYVLLCGAIILLSAYFLFHYIAKKTRSAFDHTLTELRDTKEALTTSEQKIEKNLEDVKRAKEEEKKQNWVTAGLARFSNLLYQNNSLQELGDEVLRLLAEEIDAQISGFYILQEDNDGEYLELISAFAFERKKFMEKRIAIGEGMVGQVYLEGKYFYMKEVPPGYLEIFSGFGFETPRNVLIAPMIANEKVEGILEIGSFKIYEEHEIDFINQIGENIAKTLNSIRISDQTKKLLDRSQIQNEEMKAQEEELRQNMEELAATQEVMDRKEKELQEALQEISNKNIERRIDNIHRSIEHVLLSAKNELRFLTNVPPVFGLNRALKNGGFDQEEQTDTNTWRKRMHTILYSLLDAKGDYEVINYYSSDGVLQVSAQEHIPDFEDHSGKKAIELLNLVKGLDKGEAITGTLSKLGIGKYIIDLFASSWSGGKMIGFIQICLKMDQIIQKVEQTNDEQNEFSLYDNEQSIVTVSDQSATPSKVQRQLILNETTNHKLIIQHYSR